MANFKITGGTKWRRLLSKLTRGGLNLRVGVLENATNEVTNELVASYAIKNEFGDKEAGIPPRPAFRKTRDEKAKDWDARLQRYLKNKTTEPGRVELALSRVGEVMVRDLKDKIRSNMPPANSPETIARKGEGKGTLIDTGSYDKSINYVVDK